MPCELRKQSSRKECQGDSMLPCRPPIRRGVPGSPLACAQGPEFRLISWAWHPGGPRAWITLSSLSLSRSLFGVAVNRTSIGPQACLTLCDPMDGSPPGSSVHGFSQARILEWVAISFSRSSSRPRDQN